MVLAGGGHRLLAIGGFHELVAVPPQAHAQNVAIGLIVVNDENARRLVHRNAREIASAIPAHSRASGNPEGASS